MASNDRIPKKSPILKLLLKTRLSPICLNEKQNCLQCKQLHRSECLRAAGGGWEGEEKLFNPKESEISPYLLSYRFNCEHFHHCHPWFPYGPYKLEERFSIPAHSECD